METFKADPPRAFTDEDKANILAKALKTNLTTTQMVVQLRNSSIITDSVMYLTLEKLFPLSPR